MLAKRTKVVCTLGPAADGEPDLRNLVQAGMDVARLNFGHGDACEHLARLNRLKKVRRELDTPTAVMVELRGSGIRTGLLEGGEPVRLQAGRRIVLTAADAAGSARKVHQSFPGLAAHVRPGASVLLDDGQIELAVDECDGDDVVCTVQNTGMLGERKSVHLPDVDLGLPLLTDADRETARFAVEQGADFLAVPGVRDAADVACVRELLAQLGGAGVSVVAKIDNAAAVEHAREIALAADAVVVDRGNLGVLLGAEQVPHIQKNIAAVCRELHTPVVIATQLLDSMERMPRPTRAEVSDIASAVDDRVDALLLSGETAQGKYPVPAVQMMARIVRESEARLHRPPAPAAPTLAPPAPAPAPVPPLPETTPVERVSPSVGLAAVRAADAVDAACIVTPTESGRTARLLSNLRPARPVYAVTEHEEVARRVQLCWGVAALVGSAGEHTMSSTVAAACETLRTAGLAHDGDIVVVTAGDAATSPRVTGADGCDGGYAGTNVMCVVQVGVDAGEGGEAE